MVDSMHFLVGLCRTGHFFVFSPVHWKQQVELNNHKTM